MAATAPVPGSRAEATNARKFMRIRVKDDTYDFVPELDLREKFVVRAATGLPFEAFMPAEQEREFGEDSLFVIWWLARRQTKEPALPFVQAEKEWAALDLGEGDLGAELIDLDGEPVEDDSPGGDGPAS